MAASAAGSGVVHHTPYRARNYHRADARPCRTAPRLILYQPVHDSSVTSSNSSLSLNPAPPNVWMSWHLITKANYLTDFLRPHNYFSFWCHGLFFSTPVTFLRRSLFSCSFLLLPRRSSVQDALQTPILFSRWILWLLSPFAASFSPEQHQLSFAIVSFRFPMTSSVNATLSLAAEHKIFLQSHMVQLIIVMSESVGWVLRPVQHMIDSSFQRQSFQTITCTDVDNQTRNKQKMIHRNTKNN